LDKLTQEVINIKQALATFEEQKEVVEFFDIPGASCRSREGVEEWI